MICEYGIRRNSEVSVYFLSEVLFRFFFEESKENYQKSARKAYIPALFEAGHFRIRSTASQSVQLCTTQPYSAS
jgi:competence protein ComGF